MPCVIPWIPYLNWKKSDVMPMADSLLKITDLKISIQNNFGSYEELIKGLNLQVNNLQIVALVGGSNSEARRLAEQGALEVDGKVWKDLKETRDINKKTIRIGKRGFFLAKKS